MKGINFPITIKFYDILFEVNEKTLSNFIQKSDDFESLGEFFEAAKENSIDEKFDRENFEWPYQFGPDANYGTDDKGNDVLLLEPKGKFISLIPYKYFNINGDFICHAVSVITFFNCESNFRRMFENDYKIFLRKDFDSSKLIDGSNKNNLFYKNGEIISDPNNFFSLPDNKIDEGSDDYIDVAGENTLFRFEEYDFLRYNSKNFN